MCQFVCQCAKVSRCPDHQRSAMGCHGIGRMGGRATVPVQQLSTAFLRHAPGTPCTLGNGSPHATRNTTHSLTHSLTHAPRTITHLPRSGLRSPRPGQQQMDTYLLTLPTPLCHREATGGWAQLVLRRLLHALLQSPKDPLHPTGRPLGDGVMHPPSSGLHGCMLW